MQKLDTLRFALAAGIYGAGCVALATIFSLLGVPGFKPFTDLLVQLYGFYGYSVSRGGRRKGTLTHRCFAQVKEAILRLVELHGREVTDERAVNLTIWPNPDGKYLIKGGGPKVWKKFRLRKDHRRLQGFIHGKWCGTMENIGPAARARRRGSNDAEAIAE
jgi:hypothetical protein